MMKHYLQKRLLLLTLAGVSFSQLGHAQLATRQHRLTQHWVQYNTMYTGQAMKGSPQQISHRTSRASRQKNNRNKD